MERGDVFAFLYVTFADGGNSECPFFFPQKSHLHERYGVTNGSGMQNEIPKNAAYFFFGVIPLREPPEILESKSGPRKTTFAGEATFYLEATFAPVPFLFMA